MTTTQALGKARALEIYPGPEETERQMLRRIAAALMRAYADGMEIAHNYGRWQASIEIERIRAEADELERGESTADKK